MITVGPQDILISWLCARIGYVPTPNMRCIGRLKSGKLVGVVGYDGFNDTSCQIHVAGEGNWVDREILQATFKYPFEHLGLKVLIGLVPSGNAEAIRFNEHLGFKIEARIKDAHPDGELLVMSMRREDCRWIREKLYGKEKQASGSAAA